MSVVRTSPEPPVGIKFRAASFYDGDSVARRMRAGKDVSLTALLGRLSQGFASNAFTATGSDGNHRPDFAMDVPPRRRDVSVSMKFSPPLWPHEMTVPINRLIIDSQCDCIFQATGGGAVVGLWSPIAEVDS